MNDISGIQFEGSGDCRISPLDNADLFSFRKQLVLSGCLIDPHIGPASICRIGIGCIDDRVRPDFSDVVSDDTEYMATITSAGTLTIKATDNGNSENYTAVSLTVVDTLNAVNVPNVTNHSSELTFSDKYSDGGEKVDGVSSSIWTVDAGDADESTYDSSNGIHYGTNNASVQYVHYPHPALLLVQMTQLKVLLSMQMIELQIKVH